MRLHLQMGVLRELLADRQEDDASSRTVKGGLALGSVTPALLSAATRLVALLGSPRDIRVLAPLAERELLYRLLQSDQAARLRQIARADSRLSQINKVIDLIKSNYEKPLHIDDLARRASMGPSALYEHFKAVTAMSPLQYQKRIRLQQARSLMLARAVNAATAAYEVGYESPSQLSREYKRLFGVSPAQDLGGRQGVSTKAMSRRPRGPLRSLSVNEA
jgi:transcriptional regulator GlxA family with amidase domain